MDFKRYITRKELEDVYLGFGINIDAIFEKHVKRFWKNEEGKFLNPNVYSLEYGKLLIKKNSTGRISIGVFFDEQPWLPLRIECLDCGKIRKLMTFQKLMMGDHSKCRSCVAKKVQSRPETRRKQRETCVERYGGPAPLCSSEVRKKMQDTLVERLGVPFAAQSNVVKEKYRQTCFKNWGVSNYLASDKNLSSSSSGRVSKFSDVVEEQLIDLFPDITFLREKFFSILDKRYFVDFYCEDKKLIVECYGQYWHADCRKYHANEELKFPNGVVKTAEQVWKEDEERIANLLQIEEIENVVIVCEYDVLNNNNYMKPVKDFFNEKD